MKIKDKTTFKSQGLYNLTAKVQENTLLNRGILDIGGFAIPTVIMSNNKDERIERATLSGLYTLSAFFAPVVMLPFFNKKALLRNKIIENFNGNERKIIEVSKKFLTKDVSYMIEGITQTGKKLGCSKEFEDLLNRFDKKENELKNSLIKAHENILFWDFISTSLMWCATPWLAAGMTKLRTKRSGFSATYSMIDEKQSQKNAKEYERNKRKKMLQSACLGIVPAIIFPKLLTLGMNDKLGKLSSVIKNNAHRYNYTKGIYPSQAIFATIWLLSDYPSSIVSARDKYERRDRAVRNMAAIFVFFGGDFLLNNILGRLSDNFLKTQIMDTSNLAKDAGFLKRFSLVSKNFNDSEVLSTIPKEVLKRTKNIGASMYWLTLVANMGLLGFALPAVMNKFLKTTLKKDMSGQDAKQAFDVKIPSKVFENFKAAN